jgi:hypothetical protein
MFCSFSTDFIDTEAKCGQRLSKIVHEELNKKKTQLSRVTLFCCRAFAGYSAPLAPILFRARPSVVSVYEK